MMLNKLVKLISLSAMFMLVAGSGSAAVLIPGGSTFSVNLAALPTITISGTYAGGATLTTGIGGHSITTTAGLFQTAGFTAGTSLMTGVALIENMTLVASNDAATYSSQFGPTTNPWGGNLTAGNPNFSAGSGTLCANPDHCMGAGGSATSGTFTGSIIINTIAGVAAFPLGAIGLGGTDSVTIAGQPIVATGGPWVTGKVQVTGIETNVISVPGRGGATGVAVEMGLNATEGASAKVISTMGGFTSTGTGMEVVRNTVNFGGMKNLASSAVGGTVTMISATRVNTGPLQQGIIPGVFKQTFKFVPEPGTVLLLVSGAAGLVALGRRRMKS